MKRIGFLLAFALTQANPTSQGQQTIPTASIEGSVVHYGTLDGISRAKVTLTPASSSVAGQAVIADSDGKFGFRDLAAGSYRISVSRDGYVSSEYGQLGPNGAGVAITLSSQQHSTDIRIGMTMTGAIGGRISNRYGEPVGNANVQALRYTYQDGRRVLNSVQTARTNDRGEYRLFWMAPGQYIVSAQPADQVSLDAGETVMMQAPRGGLPGLLGGPSGAGGVARITITGAANMGDLIGPGGPGGAAPPPLPPPAPAVANPEIYLPVYFPGTTDVSAATPVDLHAGGNVDGVNLIVVDVHPVRIRGQVLNGGLPASGAQVSFYTRSNPNGGLTIRGATTNDTGMFEFRNVAPGAYEIAATLNSAGPGVLFLGTPLATAAGFTAANVTVARGGRNSGTPNGTPGTMMGARIPVDVNAADIDGVSLVLENGFNINGKIRMDGTSASDSNPTFSGLRVQLQSDPQIPPLAVPPVSPENDGSFSISGVTPGNYRLSVAGLPRNTYIKTARLAGTDIFNDGHLRIDGEPRGPLDIVLGSTPGSLDAVALDDKQMPESAVTVVLVPDGSQARRPDLYRNATSDAAGKIHWDGIAPGDYKVFAWEDIESGAWTDPEFLHSVEGRGVPVHIDDRGRAMITVRVIPYTAN